MTSAPFAMYDPVVAWHIHDAGETVCVSWQPIVKAQMYGRCAHCGEISLYHSEIICPLPDNQMTWRELLLWLERCEDAAHRAFLGRLPLGRYAQVRNFWIERCVYTRPDRTVGRAWWIGLGPAAYLIDDVGFEAGFLEVLRGIVKRVEEQGWPKADPEEASEASVTGEDDVPPAFREAFGD